MLLVFRSSGALPNISSSSSVLPFRPQILHATTARAPRSIAPPMPTTTPIIVFFVDLLNPELLPSFPPFSPGALVEVALPVVLEAEALLVMT